MCLFLIISGEMMTTTTHQRPELSIVMASCRDYPGVWSTVIDIVQGRLALGLVDQIEIVCVANEPDGPHVGQKRKLFEGIPNSRFVHMPTPNGTAIAKNRAIAEATGLAFVCLDCHVFLRAGVLARLVTFWRENAGSRDLYHGPNLHGRVVAADGKPSFVGTHFAEMWGDDGMFGQWRVHEPAREPDAEPFRIPMSGCGLFSGWKDNWPGFHPEFRAFGPEEGYIHAKYRQIGGEVWCLPWLQWIHRYGHTDPVMYPDNWLHRTRGYLLSLRDVGYPAIRGTDPLDVIRSVCVRPDRITAAQWDALVQSLGLSPRPVPPPQPAAAAAGLPVLNEWDKQYLETMPCRHRGRQEAVILCNRGCPSQQNQSWAAFACKLKGGLVTLGDRRTDLQSCLACDERHQQDELPPLVKVPAGMSARRMSPGPRQLAVLCCYFNPAGWQSIRENYLRFREQARTWDVPVYAAEVAFDGQEFPTDDARLQLRGGPENMLWQKERLLNLLVAQFPEDMFDAFAWIDSDLEFDQDDWHRLALLSLRDHAAVQLFDELRMLGPHGEIQFTKRGIGPGGERYRKREASPGGAWAARRDVFPLYDRHIVGGGDSATLEAWIGIWDSWMYQTASPGLQADWRRWGAQAWSKVRRNVASLPVTAAHWYHGEHGKRGYGTRSGILTAHGFDPAKHVFVDADGLLAWQPEAPPELVADVAEYFRSRDEDANRAAA